MMARLSVGHRTEPSRASRRRFLGASGLGMTTAALAACTSKTAKSNSATQRAATQPPTVQPQEVKGLQIKGIQFLANPPDFTLQPKSGGTFRYGYNADPQHLD